MPVFVQASLIHEEIPEEPEADAERPLTMLDTLPEAKVPVVIAQQQSSTAVPPPLNMDDAELEYASPAWLTLRPRQTLLSRFARVAEGKPTSSKRSYHLEQDLALLVLWQ